MLRGAVVGELDERETEELERYEALLKCRRRGIFEDMCNVPVRMY